MDMANSDLVVNTTQKMDMLTKQLYIQSRSFDDVVEMCKNHDEMLRCIPAIQPISNKDLRKTASGYGTRIDPIYGTTKFHAGMDFSAHPGTEVYATGDGKVVKWDGKPVTAILLSLTTASVIRLGTLTCKVSVRNSVSGWYEVRLSVK